jgi:thiol-disulfide isomerase/thioredoxin
MKTLFYIICISIVGLMHADAQTGFATIQGRLNFLKDQDTVILTIYKVGYPFIEEKTIYKTPLFHQKFKFKVPAKSIPQNISLTYKEIGTVHTHSNKLLGMRLNNFYLENEDLITIADDHEQFVFTGRHAEKFKIINRLDIISRSFSKGLSWDEPLNTKRYFLNRDSLLIEQIKYLRLHKTKLSAAAYTLVKADILGQYLSRYDFVNAMLPTAKIKMALDNLSDYKCVVPLNYLQTQSFDKSKFLKFSDSYTDGLRTKYLYDSCTLKNRPDILQASFKYYLQKYKGDLRERLLLNELFWKKESTEDITPYVNKALTLINYQPFITILKNFKSKRLPGSPAYNFSLPDTSGKIHIFSEYKGKVVLLDFWFTGCGGCKLSLPNLEKVEARYRGQPVVFITISDDAKKDVWINTIRSHNYTSLYSIDLFANGQANESQINKYYSVDGNPTFILIDKKGNIMVNPENPRFDNGKSLIELIDKELLN